MTIRPEDGEPESARARGAAWFSDPAFTWPSRAPWSEIGPSFIADTWGFGLPPGKKEHVEVVGPTGSGKTYWVETILQDHYREAERRRIAAERKHLEMGAVFVATKRDDDVFAELGWPVAATAQEIDATNVILWPRTKKTGTARRDWQEARIRPFLEKLWQPRANTLLAFDEIGWVEGLSGEVRALIQMYWREARSMNIQLIGMKQRPQGALRDMHSETFWTAVFKPLDRSDAERFAELLGHRRDWLPVLDSLDLGRHEFVLRHSRSGESFITWADLPLRPQKIRREGLAGRLAGRS